MKKQPQPQTQIASEPTATYDGLDTVQQLKAQIVEAIQKTNNLQVLHKCLELFNKQEMPCCFSDEDFQAELQESERSGIATDAEINNFFQKWL